jgi:hypothetical protein
MRDECRNEWRRRIENRCFVFANPSIASDWRVKTEMNIQTNTKK